MTEDIKNKVDVGFTSHSLKDQDIRLESLKLAYKAVIQMKVFDDTRWFRLTAEEQQAALDELFELSDMNYDYIVGNDTTKE